MREAKGISRVQIELHYDTRGVSTQMLIGGHYIILGIIAGDEVTPPSVMTQIYLDPYIAAGTEHICFDI